MDFAISVMILIININVTLVTLMYICSVGLQTKKTGGNNESFVN
jgi:hypothetical protein